MRPHDGADWPLCEAFAGACCSSCPQMPARKALASAADGMRIAIRRLQEPPAEVRASVRGQALPADLGQRARPQAPAVAAEVASAVVDVGGVATVAAAAAAAAMVVAVAVRAGVCVVAATGGRTILRWCSGRCAAGAALPSWET